MRMWMGAIAGLALVATLAGAGRGVAGQEGEWVLLGQRQVTDRADHDIIAVTAARGDLHRIKLTVHRASVDFHRVVVHFGNGADQDIEMRHTVPAGGESRAIDLAGGDRVIRSVEFWYDANTVRGRRATVRLYGQR